MDHVPTPRQPKHPPLQIPCWVRDSFVCSNSPLFSLYPTSQGWDATKLENGDFLQDKSIKESRSFLQEWLYFRFLAAVFGAINISVDIDDFVVDTGNGLFLNTRCLVRYIGQFEVQLRPMSLDSQVNAMCTIQAALKLAHHFIVPYCSMTSDERERSSSWPFDDSTSLSFMVLGATLTYAVRNIVRVLPDQEPGEDRARAIIKESRVDYEDWGVSRYLYDRMLGDNWCRHRMARLFSASSSITGVYYASLLDIPADNNSHAECKSYECKHAIMKDADYSIAHTHPLPECPKSFGNMEQIHRALENDAIPVLEIHIDELKKFEDRIMMNVTTYQPGVKFVAISHVWADGLGNVADNCLPTCQLQRLKGFVKKLYPLSSKTSPVRLWIDTICVPRKLASDDKDYRKMAIDLLQKTYEVADKVLVVDKQLCESPPFVPPEEALMRILSSGWMTRLWTLQEGLLAQKLRFQFKERALDSEDLLSDVMPFHHSSVWFEVVEFFTSLTHLKTSNEITKFRLLWNFLQWRATGHKSDETVCLSILNGLIPSRVAGLSLEQRMKTFFDQLSFFPHDLAFMPGPRLSGDGWGWAPTSLMARYQWTAYGPFDQTLLHGSNRHTLQNPSSKSIRTKTGLVLRSNGLRLKDVPSTLDASFWVNESHREGQNFWFIACYVQDKDCPSWTDIDLRTVGTLSLILEWLPGPQETAPGIHVETWADKRNAPGWPSAETVRFRGRMTLSYQIRSPFPQEIGPYYVNRGRVLSRLCKGQLTEAQMWCIG